MLGSSSSSSTASRSIHSHHVHATGSLSFIISHATPQLYRRTAHCRLQLLFVGNQPLPKYGHSILSVRILLHGCCAERGPFGDSIPTNDSSQKNIDTRTSPVSEEVLRWCDEVLAWYISGPLMGRMNHWDHMVTRVAAWIRAETGVGPSIAHGNHVCKPICADCPTEVTPPMVTEP